MAFLWHLLAIIGITLPSILGYNLVFGKGKILHLGPVASTIVAAYATFLTLYATDSYALAILASIVASLLLSLLFAWLSLRLAPDGFSVMTIAVHLALLAVVLNWTSLTRGALGIPGIRRLEILQSLEGFALVSILLSTLWAALLWMIHRHMLGRRLAALSEHPWHAQALGISRVSTHILAFVIAGFGSVITGALYPQYLHLLHPNDYAFSQLIFATMLVVAGGPGSVVGATIAAVLLMLLREGLRFVALPAAVLGPVRLILFGVILFAAIWLRRDRIFPAKRTV